MRICPIRSQWCWKFHPAESASEYVALLDFGRRGKSLGQLSPAKSSLIVHGNMMFGSLRYKCSPPNRLKYSPTNAVLARSPPTAVLCIIQSIPKPHASIVTESRLNMFLPCSFDKIFDLEEHDSSAVMCLHRSTALLNVSFYIPKNILLLMSWLVFLATQSPVVGAMMYSSCSRSDDCSSYGQNRLDLVLHCQNNLFSKVQIFTLIRPLAICHVVS